MDTASTIERAPFDASLARQLDDPAGLGPPGLQRPAPSTGPRLPPHEAPLRFDGDGFGYYRLWIVHTLLSLLTLGLYSPWAKVRKARWFAQHTVLLGDRFDYHGRPLPVLAGRLVALGLLGACSLSFDYAAWLGLLVLGLFCVVGPVLFASAQRFRLANTSWRGLRFGFDVPRRKLYAVCVPALLLWTLATVLQALGAPLWAITIASLLTLLCLPWAHARMKWMQHSHARFADTRFAFEASGGAFYKVYAKALGVLALAGGAAFLVGLVAGLLARGRTSPVSGLLAGVAAMLVVWMLAWPYFAARMQHLVWSRTTWGGLGFRGSMQAWTMLRLTLWNGILTLLTAGLYWPFAAVAIARYRVDTLTVLSDTPFDAMVLRGRQAHSPNAVGDAAVDFFGLDLGW
jgi:uncharacterized membrane protein YjgN (DUF898 family)